MISRRISAIRSGGDIEALIQLTDAADPPFCLNQKVFCRAVTVKTAQPFKFLVELLNQQPH
jgi:hypothetical protein